MVSSVKEKMLYENLAKNIRGQTHTRLFSSLFWVLFQETKQRGTFAGPRYVVIQLNLKNFNPSFW